jgi:hypothetical protein
MFPESFRANKTRRLLASAAGPSALYTHTAYCHNTTLHPHTINQHKVYAAEFGCVLLSPYRPLIIPLVQPSYSSLCSQWACVLPRLMHKVSSSGAALLWLRVVA